MRSQQPSQRDHIPGRKMQHIQESGKRIASHIANLRLLHEHLVEEVRGILLLAALLFLLPLLPLGLVLAVLLLNALLRLHHRTGDVKSHLDQLVRPGGRLPAPVFRAARRLTLGFVLGGEGELDGDLVLTRQIRVGDLGVRDFERGAVLDVEAELGLCEIRLTPVPAAERMFSAFDVDAVPDFEGFGQSFEVLMEDNTAISKEKEKSTPIISCPI